jgi:2-oxoisovalerate dehydrogenase E1 component
LSHPLAPSLERAMLVDADKIAAAARGCVDGRPPVPWHWRSASGGRADIMPAVPAPAPTVAPAPAPAAPPAPPEPPTDGEPVTMPFGDLTVSEGKIVRWAKKEGESVKAGELIAEIETDKAVVEIEAPVAGVLGRIEAPEGAVVKMGGRIGVVRPA